MVMMMMVGRSYHPIGKKMDCPSRVLHFFLLGCAFDSTENRNFHAAPLGGLKIVSIVQSGSKTLGVSVH